MIFETTSSEETQAVGREIARLLTPSDKVMLFGDLGAGKTTLIQGIISEWTGLDTSEISSPTFNYLNTFDENGLLYHFDLYRIEDEKDFYKKGFEEQLESPGICLIEWSERIPTLHNLANVRITLTHESENKRVIKVAR